MKRHIQSSKLDYVKECYKKDVEKENQLQNENSTSQSKPPERHVLNAVTSLLQSLDDDGMRAVSRVVHEKLQMMCIPLVVQQNGQISIVDGSKE